MSGARWRRIGAFWAQCARLLYWSLFKPFTYADHLREIHPDLKPLTNPDWLASANGHNAALRQFRRQATATVAIAPILLTVAAGLVITLAGFPVDWVNSTVFPVAFAVGVFARNRLGRSNENLARDRQLWSGLVLMLLSAQLFGAQSIILKGFVTGAVTLYGPAAMAALPTVAIIVRSILLVVGGMGAGVALGAAFGVAFGVAVGVVVSVSVGSVDGIVDGVVIGVAGGVAGGVAAGVAGGVVAGVAVGVAFSVAGGVALGVSTIAGALRLFSWPFEAVWMLLLRLLAGGGRAGDTLHWLPIYYDEFIVLPLPFLGRFVADAYRTNQAGARQAIDYLTTHSRQQAAARYAQRAIAVDAMRRCAHTGDIAHIADELGWVAPFAAQQADAHLPALLDVSRNVRAAGSATTPFRRAAALQTQLDELHAIRQGLAAAPATVATQYGGIVDGWIGILAAAVSTLQQQASGSEIPAVYIAGPHLRPEEASHLFVGRHDLIREIEGVIAAPRPNILVLHGQRRTGKTSLLAFLPVRLPAHWLPLRVNVQAITAAESSAGVAYLVAAEMVESARRSRNLRLKLPERKEFAGEPFLALADWLRLIERAAPKQTRFLLCLDEFQRLEETFAATHSRALLDILRDLYEHRPRWALLFTSSSAAAQMAPFWSDYLINARRLHISYLQPAEARQLIEAPTPDFQQHLRYEEAAVAAILHLTHGQPFLVQLLCSELVDLLNQAAGADGEPRRVATAGDVETAVGPAFQHGGYYFDELWASLDGEQRAVLSAVARQEPACAPAPAGATAQALAVLTRREILASNGEGLTFQVPLIARWVREHGDAL